MSDAVIGFGEELRRKEFGLAENLCYLNHGSYGAVPLCVQKAQQRYQHEMESNPDLWFRRSVFTHLRENLKAIAEFVSASPENIVFVQNSTTGIETILRSHKWKEGDVILTSDLCYGAVSRTLECLADTVKGVTLAFMEIPLPIKSEDAVVNLYKEYFKANPSIKLVIIDHITSNTAIAMPVKRLVKLCQEYDVISLIDGAHAPGQLPLALDELDADFYCGSLHKWMFMPKGSGILWVNNIHMDDLHPLVTSHGYKQGLFQEFAMQGTRDTTAWCVCADAIQFINSLGGFNRIYAHNKDLVEQGVALLIKAWNTHELPTPDSMRAPFMRLVALPKLCNYEIKKESAIKILMDFMDKYHVVVAVLPPMNGELYVRLSAQVYNKVEDYEYLRDVILENCEDKVTIAQQ